MIKKMKTGGIKKKSITTATKNDSKTQGDKGAGKRKFTNRGKGKKFVNKKKKNEDEEDDGKFEVVEQKV